MLNEADYKCVAGAPLINLCRHVPQLSHLLNKPSLEVAHELVCRFIFRADEAEWAS